MPNFFSIFSSLTIFFRPFCPPSLREAGPAAQDPATAAGQSPSFQSRFRFPPVPCDNIIGRHSSGDFSAEESTPEYSAVGGTPANAQSYDTQAGGGQFLAWNVANAVLSPIGFSPPQRSVGCSTNNNIVNSSNSHHNNNNSQSNSSINSNSLINNSQYSSCQPNCNLPPTLFSYNCNPPPTIKSALNPLFSNIKPSVPY